MSDTDEQGPGKHAARDEDEDQRSEETQDSPDSGDNDESNDSDDSEEGGTRQPGADPEDKEEIEEERQERLDPENRPDNVEVDNTDRDFDAEKGMFTDSEGYDEAEEKFPALGEQGA